MDENAGGVKSNHIITPATPTREVSVNQHRVMAELIERLLNSTSTGLCVVDRDYRIVRLNEAMRILLHRFTSLYYQENDVLINGHVPPKLKERTISLIEQCFSGETVNSQLSYPSGGVVYHYKTRVEPFNVNGETLYAVITSNDVTHAVAVQQTERRFNALIERSLDIKAMVDANGNTLYRSPASARILGHTDEEMTGASAFRNIHPEDLPLAQRTFQQALHNSGVPVHFEFRIIHKDGREVMLEGTVVNLLDVLDVKAMVVNAQDVTERKKGERERDRISADLVQRVKELEQFAYIVSHNLRAPVANILGIANAVKSSDVNDVMYQQFLDGLFSATRRLDVVLRDLNGVLEVKHAISEKRETVLLADLANDIISSIEDLVRREDIDLTFDFAAINELFTLRSYLYSIFYNLIHNAIKYRRTDMKSKIHISSERLGGNVLLHFVDNGLGMDMEKKGDQLFGLYKRFHEHVEGKGIGLFMVKTQVSALGGNVTASGSVNGGMHFIVTIPYE